MLWLDVKLRQGALEALRPDRGAKPKHSQPARLVSGKEDDEVVAGEQLSHAIGERLRPGRDLVELRVEVVEEPADDLHIGDARPPDGVPGGVPCHLPDVVTDSPTNDAISSASRCGWSSETKVREFSIRTRRAFGISAASRSA